MSRGQGLLVPVIGGAVLGEQFRGAIADIVGMGEAEVDEEGILVLGGLAFVQVVEHLLAMPLAARLGGAAPLGSVAADGEAGIRGLVAVPVLAGPHRVVAGPVEDLGQGVLDEVGRHEVRVRVVGIVRDPVRLVRDVPDRATGHDHVTGRGADAADPGSHVVGAVENHALGGEAIDVRGLERRLGVVDLEIVGRLVVDDDEKHVRAIVGEGAEGGERQGADDGPEREGEFHERW